MAERPNWRSRFASLAMVILAAAILGLALPLIRHYFDKLSGLHGLTATLIAAGAAALCYAALAAGLFLKPRLTLAVAGTAAAVLVIPSGNAIAAAAAAVIVSLTLLLGDAIAGLLWRAPADDPEDIPLLFSTGVVATGLLVLLLSDGRILGRPALGIAAVAILLFRRRRVVPLARLASALPERLFSGPNLFESLWLAFAVLAVGAAWIGALAPDVSWDALAYHLPEARDVVLTGRVRALPALFPQTLLWRNHENFLSTGFFLEGERTAHLLQFAVGVAVLPAAVVLARRIGSGRSWPLVLLAIAAYPFAIYQFHASYSDWPAALHLTAAAAVFARRDEGAGNAALGGFLAGGAVVAKIFAAFAGPAMILLLFRRDGARPRRVLAAAALFVAAVVPWMLWDQAEGGSLLAPFASSPGSFVSRLSGGHYFVSSSSDVVRSTAGGTTQYHRSAAEFFSLPYALTYTSNRYEAFNNGYGGVLALLILPGVLGWGSRRTLLFFVAALAAFVPWYMAYEPSLRYLLPLFPLYAVFAVGGLYRLTESFAGWEGRTAAVAVLVAALAFPVQFGSSGWQWKVAFGITSREEAKAALLSSYRIWPAMRPGSRAVFLGEYDLYHCPCERAYRTAYDPVNEWNDDPARWRRGLHDLRIDYLVTRTDRDDALIRKLGPDVSPVARTPDSALYAVRH